MITHTVFQTAERTPEKAALIRNGRAWSYRAFAGLIGAARGHFAVRGIAGDGIAILAVGNLLDVWVLGLALRSLGLTVMPVSRANIATAMATRGIRLVVASPAETWPGLEALCTARGLPLLAVLLDATETLGLDQENVSAGPGGHILLTSGTTGLFKKLLFTSEHETAATRWRTLAHDNTSDSLSLAFDFPAWTSVGHSAAISVWALGGTLVIQQTALAHEGLGYPGLTHAVVVPDSLASILSAPPGAFPHRPGLHLSITAGSATRTAVAEARRRITPRVFARYGSTEIGTLAMTPLDGADAPVWHQPVTGRVPEIVDDEGRPLPPGVEGRLRVSSAECPDHYLDDPETSATFFRGGFFYPGDLAMTRPDGRFTLLGRFTDVLNVRGHKLSPALVEDRMRERLGLAGLCLFTHREVDGEEVLHVAAEGATPLDREAIAAHLRRDLGLATTVRVTTVDRLPRNHMGKLMRAAVKAQVLGPDGGKDHEAPEVPRGDALPPPGHLSP